MTPQAPSARRKFLFSCILAIGLLGFLEVAAKIYLVFGAGISSWNYSTYYRNDAELKHLTWTQKYGAHPYFGYEGAAIRAFEAQRRSRSKQDYVIAVLGGSVAEMFVNYAIQHSDGFERLRSKLPEIGERRLVITNLALGGGRQPQQFFIASFFVSDVDLFINIEGFNDSEPTHLLPLYPLEFPGMALRFNVRRTDIGLDRSIASGLRWCYQVINYLPQRVAMLARSPLYFAYWRLARRALYNGVRHFEGRYINSSIRSGGTPVDLTDEEVLKDRMVIWRRYSLLQHAVISAEPGVRGFWFLQPNQYLENSKPLSEEERKTMIAESRRTYGNLRMKRMQQEFRALRAHGVPAFDLTDVFARTTETVYIDNCCHLNERGNQILLEAVVAAVENHTSAEQEASHAPRGPQAAQTMSGPEPAR